MLVRSCSWRGCGFIRKIPVCSAIGEKVGQGSCVLPLKRSPMGMVSQHHSGRGLCSWACSGFLATSTKRDSPRELADRLKFMFIHCTFALLQMKIISQKKTVVFIPHPSLETRWKPIGNLHMVTAFSKKMIQRGVVVKASLLRSGYWANTLQLFKTIWVKLPHPVPLRVDNDSFMREHFYWACGYFVLPWWFEFLWEPPYGL